MPGKLSNVIERAVVMNSGPIIFSEDLPPQIRQPVCNAGEVKTAPVGERNLKEEIKRVEKRIIMEVLEHSRRLRSVALRRRFPLPHRPSSE